MLTLEEINPYLPYRLKIICSDNIPGITYKPINVTDRIYSLPVKLLQNFKPILFPLSCLYQ